MFKVKRTKLVAEIGFRDLVGAPNIMLTEGKPIRAVQFLVPQPYADPFKSLELDPKMTVDIPQLIRGLLSLYELSTMFEIPVISVLMEEKQFTYFIILIPLSMIEEKELLTEEELLLLEEDYETLVQVSDSLGDTGTFRVSDFVDTYIQFKLEEQNE